MTTEPPGEDEVADPGALLPGAAGQATGQGTGLGRLQGNGGEDHVGQGFGQVGDVLLVDLAQIRG